MSSERTRSRGFRLWFKATLVIAFLVGVASLAVSMFQLGFTTGLAAAGGGLVAYMIPATILDWPRLTLTDVVDLVSGMISAVWSFITSLFDW